MLKISQLYKRYTDQNGPFAVVDNVNLEVATGAFVALLGPSGCGKTTTLRMIAGLEVPSSGRIEIDGVPIYADDRKLNVPVSRRPISMVFQSYAIWPHLNVFQNVAFPLQGGKFKLTRAEVRERVEEALLAVDLHNHANREPSELSGGQQQRVALARALVSRPKLLLLDEPLSNLDVRLRDQMRDKLKELHVAAKLTTIFVTHDQNEAMALASDIVVMNAGKIIETGSPQRVFENPVSRFSAGFVGKYNIFEGTLCGKSADGHLELATEAGPIRAKAVGVAQEIAPGERVLAYVRPNSIVVEQLGDRQDGITGTIESMVYQGSFWEVKIALANAQIVLAHVALAIARNIDLINLRAVRLLPAADEVVCVPAAQAI